MSTSIERLNYYEREYLRSHDFIAEQRYHIEMRRRLNRALHLWGIVDGLELMLQAASPSTPAAAFVTSGMAIDVHGREIFLFHDHAIDEDVLSDERISTPGTYAVWITYASEIGTPPSAGYRVCHLENQYTRQRESYKIVLTNAGAPGPEPALMDELAGEQEPWRIWLGEIIVTVQGGGLAVTGIKTDAKKRVYVGLRAQRIHTPTQADFVPAPAQPLDPVLAAIDSLNPPLSLAVAQTLFAQKNLIIGDNFAIDRNQIKPPPPPAAPPPPTPPPPLVFPKLSGNLKVAGDLFLQGNLYTPVGADWLGFKEFVQSLVPEIQIENADLAVGGLTSNNVPKTIISKVLKQPSKATVLVALRGTELESPAGIFDWAINLSGAAAVESIRFQVSAGVPQPTNNPSQFDCAITWTVAPASGSTTAPVHVRSLAVTYLIIFYP